MRFFLISVVSVCLVFLSSCRSQLAIQNYLQDLKDTTTRKSYYITEPSIQKNDLLSIQIYSGSLEPGVEQLYSLSRNNSNSQSSNLGYLVDQNGNIEIPKPGVIHVEGLKKSQLIDTLKTKLKDQLVDPSVVIRFLNFRIVVIGEVGSPGVKTVAVENLTILEALAMSGDILVTGKKKEVKILREYNGQRQLGIIDVTTTKMFESPYYQLQQNDVILVEATPYKVRQTEQQRVRQQLSFVLGILGSIIGLYGIFK
jgi:polysaccharide export outer membrane protein